MFTVLSVITAVGVADDLQVMVIAVLIAGGFMIWTAGSVSRFVGQHPTVKVLALSFLIMIGLVLIVLPGSRAVMGGLARPEFSTFQWGSMIMCTLLAGGGVFWAAGEPMAHFLSSPPLFGAEAGVGHGDAHGVLLRGVPDRAGIAHSPQSSSTSGASRMPQRYSGIFT